MLGGLLGKGETFAALADDWERESRAHIQLPIAYFKAEEARNRDGEFRHWRYCRRDEKSRRLASLIDRENLVMVSCGRAATAQDYGTLRRRPRVRSRSWHSSYATAAEAEDVATNRLSPVLRRTYVSAQPRVVQNLKIG